MPLGSKVVGDGITLADSTTCHAKIYKSDSISDVSSLCDNIVSVSSDLSQGVGLFIDGELAAVAPQEPLENLLDQIADNYTVTVDEEVVPFSNYIEYVEGLYKTDEISDDPTM